MKNITEIQKKAEIIYPCKWVYKIIGNESIKDTADKILTDIPFKIQKSNQSKTGRYISYNIEVTVNSAEEKDSIFHKLNNHKDIKFVL